jgi:RNA polymerase sigma-70 factor (ECF subfamily)
MVLDPSGPAAPAAAPVDIDELVREHGEAIYRVARSVVRDSALAEDVVQDTLLKVWQHSAQYRGDAPIKHWVLRIAHNTAVSALRRQREDAQDPSVLATAAERSAGVDVERNVAGQFALDELWKVLETLDPTTRSIVVLREIEGLSYEEICEVLRLPEPTVKTRLFRARRSLSEQLKDWRS